MSTRGYEDATVTTEAAAVEAKFPAPGTHKTIRLGDLEVNVYVSDKGDDVHCLSFTQYSIHTPNGRYMSSTMQLPVADIAALAALLAEVR